MSTELVKSVKREIEEAFRLAYVSAEKFCCDLEAMMAWASYNDKSKAKRTLEQNYVEGEDYILLRQLAEQNGRGGHNREIVRLSLRCAKKLLMRWTTAQAEVVRDYFVDVEEKFHSQIQVAPHPRTALELLGDAVQAIQSETAVRLSNLESVAQSQEHRLNAISDVVMDDRRARAEAIVGLELSEELPPAMTTREKCVEIVNRIARSTEKLHGTVWNEAYGLLYHRYNINAPQRTKNAGMTCVIEWIDRQGLIEKLHSVLSLMARQVQEKTQIEIPSLPKPPTKLEYDYDPEREEFLRWSAEQDERE